MSDWMYTIKDYVDLEDSTDLKHEFYNGDIRAMGGGTNEHARIGAAIVGQLYPQLDGGPCEVYSSDLRVRVGNVITYPDASVVCGEVQMDREDPKAQLNPTVLIEATSPTSERYDRGAKFGHYQRIASLREYVLVSHKEKLVEVFRRGADGLWLDAQRFGPGERVQLDSIGCELDIDKLYTDRRFAASRQRMS